MKLNLVQIETEREEDHRTMVALERASRWAQAHEVCAQASADTIDIAWVPALMYGIPCAIEAQGLVAMHRDGKLEYEMMCSNEKRAILVEGEKGTVRQTPLRFFAQSPWG